MMLIPRKQYHLLMDDEGLLARTRAMLEPLGAVTTLPLPTAPTSPSSGAADFSPLRDALCAVDPVDVLIVACGLREFCRHRDHLNKRLPVSALQASFESLVDALSTRYGQAFIVLPPPFRIAERRIPSSGAYLLLETDYEQGVNVMRRVLKHRHSVEAIDLSALVLPQCVGTSTALACPRHPPALPFGRSGARRNASVSGTPVHSPRRPPLAPSSSGAAAVPSPLVMGAGASAGGSAMPPLSLAGPAMLGGGTPPVPSSSSSSSSASSAAAYSAVALSTHATRMLSAGAAAVPSAVSAAAAARIADASSYRSPSQLSSASSSPALGAVASGAGGSSSSSSSGAAAAPGACSCVPLDADSGALHHSYACFIVGRATSDRASGGPVAGPLPNFWEAVGFVAIVFVGISLLGRISSPWPRGGGGAAAAAAAASSVIAASVAAGVTAA